MVGEVLQREGMGVKLTVGKLFTRKSTLVVALTHPPIDCVAKKGVVTGVALDTPISAAVGEEGFEMGST
jgi:hypothetical protein